MREIVSERTTPETLQIHELHSLIVGINGVMASIRCRGLALESSQATVAKHNAERALIAIKEMDDSFIPTECVTALTDFVESYQPRQNSKEPQIELIWHSL